MHGFRSPGSLFMVTLPPAEQKFLKLLLTNALKSGYKRIVEPCAGAFALSHLAVQAGFKASQIESSDVSMFSSILGCAITGQSLEKLCLHAKGFTDEELLDPATALYAWKYLSLVKNAEQNYFYNYLLDLELRREEHIKSLNEQLARAKHILGAMTYRTIDMWQHIEEVLHDSNTIVLANPPTYLGGFEKYYDTAGLMTWKEPEYSLFNPKTDIIKLMEETRNAECLLLCHEESLSGETAGSPVFAQNTAICGKNFYLTSNRSDDATALAKGKKIHRLNEKILAPLDCSILPIDSEISEKSTVQIVHVKPESAQYYRKLWTYNFTGAAIHLNFIVFIDNKIAGAFGYDKSGLSTGLLFKQQMNSMFLMYAMAVPHRKYRLGRLLTMLSQNRKFVLENCTCVEQARVVKIRTVQMSRYPEALDLRGIMKLSNRVKDIKFGYRLTYESDLKDRTEQETLIEWLRREDKWQKARIKAKQSQK